MCRTHSHARVTALLAAALLLAAAPASAQRTDVIELLNGDRVTGEIKRLDAGILTVRTNDLGTVALERDLPAQRRSRDESTNTAESAPGGGISVSVEYAVDAPRTTHVEALLGYDFSCSTEHCPTTGFVLNARLLPGLNQYRSSVPGSESPVTRAEGLPRTEN